jgi:hypothetical protein
MTDSIIQQLRDARASIAAGFGYDLSKQNKTLETTDEESKSSVARKRHARPAGV